MASLFDHPTQTAVAWRYFNSGSKLFRPFVVVVLLGVGLVASGCSSERASWKVASALNLAEQGQLDEAIDQMQAAIKLAPDRYGFKLIQARFLAMHEQGELGVALCDEVLEKYPQHDGARRVRANCLVYLGQFDEALEDFKLSVSTKLDRSSVELNNLAYYRTLAGQELDQAVQNIELAIEKEENQPWGAGFNRVAFPVRATICLGLIARQVDRRDVALEQLERVIADLTSHWETQDRLITELVAELAAHEFPLSENRINQTSSARVAQEIARQSLGMLLATRALIHEDLGHCHLADKDRYQLRDLGIDEAEVFANLPDDVSCLGVLEKSSMFLDTRGFLITRLPWQDEAVLPWLDQLKMQRPELIANYRRAINDLDLAIASMQVLHAASNSPVYNRYDIPLKQVERERKHGLRTLAVLIFHRMEAHRKAGQHELAQQDANRISELGFDPQANLF